jgi:RND family efflux transporter MFP subunit
MEMRKLSLLAVLVVLGAVVAACAAPFTEKEEPTPTPVPTPIVPEKPVYEVKRGEVVDSVDFLCRVAPVREQELFFKMNGRVSKVYVEKGDMVKAGDILAELEAESLVNQLEQARVDLEKAQLALEQARAEHERRLEDARRNLELARARLQKAQEEQRYTIAQAEVRLKQAEAEVQEARAALQKAQLDYADAVNDPNRSGPALEAYRAAQLKYELALANLDVAKMDLERAQAGVDPAIVRAVEDAQREVQILEQGVDPSLEKNVEAAKLRMDSLASQLDAARIVAPFDGQVTGVLVFEGREAQAYKPVIVVAEPGNYELSCDLTSSVLQRLAEGMEARIVFSDSPGEQLVGKVRRLPYPYGGGGISGQAEQQDKSTRISIEDTKGRKLEPGQLAKVNVVIERKDNVLYLPPQAIRTFEGRRFVVVQEPDGRQRRVDVRVGIQDAAQDRVEIVEGLEEGMVVIGP